MEWEYKRLQKIAEKSKSDAWVHEDKAQRMVEGYTKVKNKNEKLYEANKKLWTQIKKSKTGRFFGTHWKEEESSQKGSDRWQQ